VLSLALYPAAVTSEKHENAKLEPTTESIDFWLRPEFPSFTELRNIDSAETI
jgi:hypothetical protein